MSLQAQEFQKSIKSPSEWHNTAAALPDVLRSRARVLLLILLLLSRLWSRIAARYAVTLSAYKAVLDNFVQYRGALRFLSFSLFCGNSIAQLKRYIAAIRSGGKLVSFKMKNAFVPQMEQEDPCKFSFVSSSLTEGCDLITQREEYSPFKRGVVGSNPTGVNLDLPLAQLASASSLQERGWTFESSTEEKMHSSSKVERPAVNGMVRGSSPFYAANSTVS